MGAYEVFGTQPDDKNRLQKDFSVSILPIIYDLFVFQTNIERNDAKILR